ncbi:Hypothetical predicted protein [Mytilus galloprovincialis]|uniref:Mutator-like transposase domain-containing protein n=1 Tax=Mytilus galloprovincialis TaxID=29158 RepID=A0A8B6D950_MYTGA|nr:Hypothetical predicted protein [Mytilus galloprovincialis]
MDLFKICPKCCGSANASIAHTVGTLIKVNVTCELCQHSYSWYSQPFLGSVPAGNLAVSSAILYSGALPTKVLRLMNFMNIPTISHQTFFNHQRHILYPAVLRFWKHQQMQHIAKYRDPTESLVLGGDGRADTPGHSAKYGSYSMMDLKQGVVLDIQLVQSNEVSSSNAMEKEGLIRSLKWFEDNNLQFQTLITDQHVQIVKFVREQTPHITHYFDVWHVAKGLKKKMVKISKEKDCKEVGEWIKSITNHMYWVAASTPNGDSEEMVSKWLSVANHVQNKHRGHSDQVANCLHGELVGHDRKKNWLKPGTKACVKTEELLTATRLKTSVEKLSPIHQTSDVEAFHSTINHFAPKMIGFSFHGMQCRLLLAALHFNENSARPQALTKDGVARYSIQFPKYKSGGYITREKKINQSFRYVNTLLRSIRKIVDVTTIRSTSEEPMPTPRPLCAAFTRPQKTDAIQAMKSRFRKAEI